MGGFDEAFKRRLEINGFTTYSIGLLIISLRLYVVSLHNHPEQHHLTAFLSYAQFRKNGVHSLKADDYLMFLALALYTLLIGTLVAIVSGGGSNLFLPEELPTFSQDEIADRVYGSKLVVVSEQAMLNLIYILKACLLLFYARLTAGTSFLRLTRYLAIYVAVGYVATQIGFFVFCRPFWGYWAVPPPDAQCTTLQFYAINQACWNISSDILMLCVPLPIVWKLKMPVRQKVGLGIVFTLGGYVIVAAVLTKAFNLSDVYDPSYMLWYIREASVAVYVANLPILWPLLREWLPCLRHSTRSPTLPLSTYKSFDNEPKRFSRSRFSWRKSGHGADAKATVTSIITGPLSRVSRENTRDEEKRPKSVVLSMNPASSPILAGKSKGMSTVTEEISTIGLERPSRTFALRRTDTPKKSSDWDRWTINVETTFDMESSVDVAGPAGQRPPRKEIVSSIGKAHVRRVS
jgi:hypothetical protein